jgi:hypothetical protein
MCGDPHEPETLNERDVLSAPSRRTALKAGVSAVMGGLLVRSLAATRASADTFGGSRALVAAMHVHGSWSEQRASWEAYGPRARDANVDIVFMTDHDYRALSDRYWQNLVDVPFRSSFTGALAQQATVKSGGALRLLAESSSPTTQATAAMTVDDVTSRVIWDSLRTSIAGQSLRPTFGRCTLTNRARFAIRVTLSTHPAFGSRPAGGYELRYRFGPGLAVGRLLQDGGLTGVVTRPLPAPDTTVALDLQADVQALWPDMIATDNGFYQLSFVASSPRSGAVADIEIVGMDFVRTGHDSDSIARDQRLLADTYGSRYGLTMHTGFETGRGLPHLNGFVQPQFFPDQLLNRPATRDDFYRGVVSEVHRRGGLVSWNHPFGASQDPLLTPAEQSDRRRQLFATMRDKDLYGCDILEVGYATRGQADMATHLDLWDSFSRHARFLTGNGVNDDHSAGDWRSLRNGFATGIWATSAEHASLMAALRAGRAYTAHAGLWPGGQLDLRIDATVLMGQASISSRISRTLEVQAAVLPRDSRVEIVAGPVDFAGSEPGTTVLYSVPATSFGASGLVRRSIDTSSACFVRTQVRNSAGELIGASNPVWLLRAQPPGGIPLSRQA